MSAKFDAVKQIMMPLTFVKNHAIDVVEIDEGICTARLPYDPTFSSPPGIFPAAMASMLGSRVLFAQPWISPSR